MINWYRNFIEEVAENMTPERNVEPVPIMENLDNEEIEQMVNKIREGMKIIQQEKKQTELNRRLMNLNQKQRK